MKIRVKYVQKVESILIKMEDKSDFHWFNSRLIGSKNTESGELEWIDNELYRVTWI